MKPLLILFISVTLMEHIACGQCGPGNSTMDLELAPVCVESAGENVWQVNNPNSFGIEVIWDVLAPDFLTRKGHTGTHYAAPGLSYFRTNFFSRFTDVVSITWTSSFGVSKTVFANAKEKDCKFMQIDTRGETHAFGTNMYPNTVQGGQAVTVEISSTRTCKAMMLLLNVEGKSLINKEIEILQGFNRYQLKFPATKPGYYFLSVNEKLVGRIIAR